MLQEKELQSKIKVFKQSLGKDEVSVLQSFVELRKGLIVDFSKNNAFKKFDCSDRKFDVYITELSKLSLELKKGYLLNVVCRRLLNEFGYEKPDWDAIDRIFASHPKLQTELMDVAQSDEEKELVEELTFKGRFEDEYRGTLLSNNMLQLFNFIADKKVLIQLGGSSNVLDKLKFKKLISKECAAVLRTCSAQEDVNFDCMSRIYDFGIDKFFDLMVSEQARLACSSGAHLLDLEKHLLVHRAINTDALSLLSSEACEKYRAGVSFEEILKAAKERDLPNNVVVFKEYERAVAAIAKLQVPEVKNGEEAKRSYKSTDVVNAIERIREKGDLNIKFAALELALIEFCRSGKSEDVETYKSIKLLDEISTDCSNLFLRRCVVRAAYGSIQSKKFDHHFFDFIKVNYETVLQQIGLELIKGECGRASVLEGVVAVDSSKFNGLDDGKKRVLANKLFSTEAVYLYMCGAELEDFIKLLYDSRLGWQITDENLKRFDEFVNQKTAKLSVITESYGVLYLLFNSRNCLTIYGRLLEDGCYKNLVYCVENGADGTEFDFNSVFLAFGVQYDGEGAFTTVQNRFTELAGDNERASLFSDKTFTVQSCSGISLVKLITFVLEGHGILNILYSDEFFRCAETGKLDSLKFREILISCEDDDEAIKAELEELTNDNTQEVASVAVMVVNDDDDDSQGVEQKALVVSDDGELDCESDVQESAVPASTISAATVPPAAQEAPVTSVATSTTSLTTVASSAVTQPAVGNVRGGRNAGRGRGRGGRANN